MWKDGKSYLVGPFLFVVREYFNVPCRAIIFTVIAQGDLKID